MPEPVAYHLPDLGEGMTEAEVVRWTVAVGEHVDRDQVVAHVQTDKAEVELPAPEAGTVSRLGGDVGDLLTVGAVLIEYVPDAPRAGDDVAPTARRVASAPGVRPETPSRAASPGPLVQAPPPVRKLALSLGVDLATVAGTGPQGRITAADVRAAAGPVTSPGVAAPAADSADASHEIRREPLRGFRRSMAQNLADAWREIPHVTLFDEIDARPLGEALRAARDRTGDPSLRFTALFVRAAVVALADQPILNAAFDAPEMTLEYHRSCHIGIAVASPHGLVVPAIRDAHARSLGELGAEVRRLTAVARAGHLAPEDLNGATFTITNFGTQGGRFATPIVTPPQVGILGLGAIRTRPLVEGDVVVAAPTLPIALSVDHRVIDGQDAITFIERVARLLQEPGQLLSGLDGPPTV